MYHDKTIWIIGASSGIGEALAKELAARGATLALSARREDKLTALQQALGDRHCVTAIDIADADSVARAACTVFAHYPRVDSVVIMAAAYEPLALADLTPDIVQKIITTNLIGTFYVVQTVLPLLLRQGGAQLALCGSVAGYLGLPNGQPYSATKAAIINLAESLDAEHGDKIDIKLISPGFVKTPLTDKNPFPMPFILTPEQAANAIATGLEKPGFEIHFPKKFTFIVKFIRLLPYGLSLRIARYFRHSAATPH